MPTEVASRVRSRVRVPLFSAMVAIDAPIDDVIPYAGLTVKTKGSPVWFAARSQSKPQTSAAKECWVIVSRPAFAAAEIARETMQDATTSEIKPQTGDYLQSVGRTLWDAFGEAVEPWLKEAGRTMPGVEYLQAQRWGSALPAPANRGGRDINGYSAETTVEVCGGRYEEGMPPVSGEHDDESGGSDYVALDSCRIAYAGDFCSRRAPGFEAAALSGLDAATHMAKVLLGSIA